MKRFAGCGFLAITMLGFAATADGQQDEAAPTVPMFSRPAYSGIRSNENWSVLRDVTDTEKDDLWDPIKYIPLSDDGEVWLSFGGQMRARYESWSGFGFGAPDPDDDSFGLWRLLLHADLHLGDRVRAFVQGKSALSTDRDLPGGRRGLDVDTIALEQAFVDVIFSLGDGGTLTVRPGRQVFSFGKQRLVSPLPWANTLRRWDGVSAILRHDDWTVTGFWSQFAPVQKYSFNDSDAQAQFFGVYATGKVPNTSIGLDVYFLGLDREGPVTFNGTIGEESRYTIGDRVFGKFGDSGFDFDLEGAYQFGEVGSGDISAFMLASQLGFHPADMRGAPRFFVGLDYASGDETAGGDVETFNHLFPLGHAYYGYADVVGRQNAVDLNVGATCTPLDRLTVAVTGHLLWLADDSDALYNAGGAVVRSATPGASRDLGAELDLTLKYSFDRHLSGLVGYSHFFAGDFQDDTGSGDDLDFFYLQLQYTF